MKWLKSQIKHALKFTGRSVVSIKAAEEYSLYRYAASCPGDVVKLLVHGAILKTNARTFVQIGANDGIRDDDLNRYVRNYNLSGILVEPQPATFKRLLTNYEGQRQVQFENAAIAEQPGNFTLYKFDGDAEGTIQLDVFTSPFRERLERAKIDRKIHADIIAIQVPALTFDNLMQRHKMPSIDILVIDTEGYDYKILKMVDFKRWQPAIVQFEHVHLSVEDALHAYELLAGAGYGIFRARWETFALKANGAVADVA